MGSSTLPLHHREGKALLPKALSSPRKVLSLVFLLGFVLYILSSSSQFSDSTLPTHLPSTDYLITSSFWPVGLDLEKSAYSQLTKDELKSISAVILRVTDDDSILASVEHLSKYPFIQHIYIQNLIDKPLDARVRERMEKTKIVY
jgi:hypothetical protein